MDDGAFSGAICKERRLLVGWVRAKFRLSTDAAEDFVQETLLRAWLHRDRYDEQQKLRAWLMTILMHLVLSDKRKNWRLKFSDDMTAFETPIPGNQFDALYLKEVLAEMVKLPLDQLDAIVFIARGEQYNEVGEIMQANLGTVKSRASRGRRTLREALDD